MRIAVLNGPNLNLLGVREPHLYGHETLAQINERLGALARELDVEISFAQFNGEGEMIDAIHAMRGAIDGVIINAGAYTHTSLAIRDAFAATGICYVEVHLSNIFAREPERHYSMLASGAIGILCGFGAYGYEMGLRGLVTALSRG